MTPHRRLSLCLPPLCLLFVFALGAAATPARACDDPPADTRAMRREMQAEYSKGNYQKALELGEKLNKLEPDESEHMYNMACLHCLLGHKDKAYQWLEKAIDAGYSDGDHMAKDEDFRAIAGEDRFRGLVKRLRGDEKPKSGVKKKDRGRDEDEGDDDEDDDDDVKDKQAAAKAKKAEQPEKPKKEAKAKKNKDEDEDDDENAADKSAEVNELTQDLIAAAEAKDYDKALKLSLKANKIADNGLTNYNVACMYSLKNEKDKALEHLEKAIKKGDFPRDIVTQMEGDTDLDNIREDARYEKIVGMAKKSGKGEVRDVGSKVKFEWTVTLPKKQGESMPLVVILHEKGGNMKETSEHWKKAADKVGAVLLAPQGTFKTTRNKFLWGRDIDAIEKNVMDAIDNVADEHKCDKKKIVLAGFSEGGSLAWALALRNADKFCGVIPVCGRCEARSDSAFDGEDIAKLRVFVACGADDNEALIKSNKDAAKKLEKKGAKVKVSLYDDVEHAYPDDADAELAKALKFVLGD